MRIVIAEPRDPFARQSASRASLLAGHLLRKGHEIEGVALPVTRDSRADASAWRLLNLARSNLRPIDLVIATAFPAYCVRHPRKVAWIAEPGDEAPVAADLVDLRARMLAECTRVVAFEPRAPGIPWDAVIEQLLG